MNFGENALLQISYLERTKGRIEEEFKLLPAGSLWTKRVNGNTYYYAHENGKNESMIDNEELLQQYRRKKQLENQLRAINRNIPLLKKMMDHYIPITPLDSWWETLKSEQNPYRQENRQNFYKGIFYRSKSEMTIAMFLTSYNIPYKYEVEVVVDEKGKKRYPDFCIERPKDKKMIYWEHCGLISRETYQHDLFYKLKEYHSVGIDLWDNLILSFDQFDGGLNADTIEKLIRMYLL